MGDDTEPQSRELRSYFTAFEEDEDALSQALEQVAGPEQLELPGAAPDGDYQAACLKIESARGQYTGERFIKAEPVKAALVLLLRSRGCPVNRVSREFGISRELVQAIEKSEGEAIRQFSEGTAAACRYAALLYAERLAELANDPEAKVSPYQMAIIMKILVETGNLISGKPTQRIEHVQPLADADEWASFLAEAVEVEALEVEPGEPGEVQTAAIEVQPTTPGQVEPGESVSTESGTNGKGSDDT